jgi:NitT/TauT family transport system substrate-binding protein
MLQKSPAGVIFRSDSGIKTFKDLYGKKLGVPIRSVVEKQWRAVAKLQNIDESKITEVRNDAIAPLMTNKSIDAGLAFFYNDGLKLISQGVPISWILFADSGLSIYSSCLVTHEALIKENPDLVRRFTRAFLKGWSYSIEHPDEALAIFLKDNPTVDAKYSSLKLPAVLKLTQSDDTKAHGLGYSTAKHWEAMQKVLLEIGLMKNPVNVTQVFTNDFLK